MTSPLPTGATIGILGGGQLGRMLSIAASRLGLKTHIFEPGANPPAGQVAHKVTTASYDDIAALETFARTADVITYEFENVPSQAIDTLEKFTSVRPNKTALSTSQDRLIEKTFLEGLGLQVAPFANVESAAQLADAMNVIGVPSILKTRRMGYDGKGQIRLAENDDPQVIWQQMKDAPCVLEGFIPFTHEVSVIGARATDGQVACFDPGENVHRDGILHSTTVPANLTTAQRTDAVLLTGKILNALDYTGVLGVELFVTPKGLIVNEIAPRVHNSGHWTQNGCLIDQFEQHIRAVAGWPLGDGSRHADVIMENLIGADMNRIRALSAIPAVALHLYGKEEVKPGRKMGHFNILSEK